MAHRRVEIIVQGRVQGVFYRASTARRARELGVVGWVRNEPDGSVRVVAEGPEAALAALVDWCKSGPPGARVETFDARWSEPRGDLTSFVIAR